MKFKDYYTILGSPVAGTTARLSRLVPVVNNVIDRRTAIDGAGSFVESLGAQDIAHGGMGFDKTKLDSQIALQRAEHRAPAVSTYRLRGGPRLYISAILTPKCTRSRRD